MRKKEEVSVTQETFDVNNIVTDIQEQLVEVPKATVVDKVERKEKANNEALVNCLKNEKVIIRHIDKQTGLIRDPKHVLYGGMAETAKRTFTVPLLRSGGFVDVLTKSEKAFLEYTLGLEPGALSVYVKGDNNFWSTANPNGIATVTLMKHDNYLDLSNPSDYIKYKILLANKDRIAPSLYALQDTPKATYEFVVISETDTNKAATMKMNSKKMAYKILGKIEDDVDVLRFIVETVDGRPTSSNIKLDALQVKADELIQKNAATFVKIANDPSLNTKVLIRKAIEAGIIARRGDYLYMRDTGQPLCKNDQEPTLSIAAAYLDEPKQQDLKFSIEAKLK